MIFKYFVLYLPILYVIIMEYIREEIKAIEKKNDRKNSGKEIHT